MKVDWRQIVGVTFLVGVAAFVIAHKLGWKIPEEIREPLSIATEAVVFVVFTAMLLIPTYAAAMLPIVLLRVLFEISDEKAELIAKTAAVLLSMWMSYHIAFLHEGASVDIDDCVPAGPGIYNTC